MKPKEMEGSGSVGDTIVAKKEKREDQKLEMECSQRKNKIKLQKSLTDFKSETDHIFYWEAHPGPANDIY